jgi:osmotically-inducible protein OsmY
MSTRGKVRVDYSDQDIQFRVGSYLRSRHFQTLREIDIDVENGTVTLAGTVGSFYEKQIALNSCLRVAGVLHLIDHLSVSAEELTNAVEPVVLV